MTSISLHECRGRICGIMAISGGIYAILGDAENTTYSAEYNGIKNTSEKIYSGVVSHEMLYDEKINDDNVVICKNTLRLLMQNGRSFDMIAYTEIHEDTIPWKITFLLSNKKEEIFARRVSPIV